MPAQTPVTVGSSDSRPVPAARPLTADEEGEADHDDDLEDGGGGVADQVEERAARDHHQLRLERGGVALQRTEGGGGSLDVSVVT
jgi:hypothetical protein